MATSTAHPVDLLALRRACRPIIGCYERFLSEGRLEVSELDAALTTLRALPHVGGRLGRAVGLLGAGAGARSEEKLAALELLRTTSGLRVAEAQATSAPPRRSTGGQSTPAQCSQPPLPGLG